MGERRPQPGTPRCLQFPASPARGQVGLHPKAQFHSFCLVTSPEDFPGDSLKTCCVIYSKVPSTAPLPYHFLMFSDSFGPDPPLC